MDLSNRDIRIVNPGRLEPGLAREPPRPRRGRPSSAASGSGTRRSGSPTDREISDRLGWLDAPAAGRSWHPGPRGLRGLGPRPGADPGRRPGHGRLEPRSRGLRPAVPDGGRARLELEILDTTEPGAVAAAAARFDLRPDALHRLLEIGDDRRNARPALLFLRPGPHGARRRGHAGRPVRRHHRSGNASRDAGPRAPVPPHLLTASPTSAAGSPPCRPSASCPPRSRASTSAASLVPARAMAGACRVETRRGQSRGPSGRDPGHGGRFRAWTS